MSESCNINITYNRGSLGRAIEYTLWQSQKGSSDDTATFHDKLYKINNTNYLDQTERIDDTIKVLIEFVKCIYNPNAYLKNLSINMVYEQDKVAQNIVDDICDEMEIEFGDSFYNSDDFKSKFLKEFENQFKDKEEETEDNSSETKFNQNDIDDSDKSVKVAMKYYFGKTPGAQNSIHDHFRTEVRRRIFVNLDNGTIVDSLYLINYSLIKYQSELYKIITRYLNSNEEIEKSDYNLNLYDNDKLINEFFMARQEAFNYMKEKMKNVNDDESEHDRLLNSGWKVLLRVNAGKVINENDQKALDYYNFVEAYYLLRYFDDNLVHNFGNILTFSKSIKNTPMLNCKNYDKYKQSIDRRGRNNGWNKSDEDRNGFIEADRFSLGLLESFPMVSYSKFNKLRESGRVGNIIELAKLSKNIEYVSLTNAFSKMQRACALGKINTESEDSASTNGKFVNAILNFHDNPKRNIVEILNILFNKEDYDNSKNNILNTFRSNNILEDEDINILFGLYLSCFNKNNILKNDIVKIINNLNRKTNRSDQCQSFLSIIYSNPSYAINQFILSNCKEYNELSIQEQNTLKRFLANPYLYGNCLVKIENNRRGKKFNSSSYVYSDCIAGLLDRIIELEYLNIDFDKSSGELEIKLRKKWNDNQRIFDLAEQINSYVEQDHKDLVDDPDVKNKIDEINKSETSEKTIKNNKYKLTQENDNTYIIKLPNNIKIKIILNENRHMFSEYNNIEISKDGKEYVSIIDYFKDFDFLDSESDIKNDSNTILKFLSDVLGYDFLSDDSQQILYLYKLKHNNIFRELLNTGFKAFSAIHAKSIYASISTDLSFPEWLYSLYKFNKIFSNVGEINKKNKFVYKPESKILSLLKDQYSFRVILTGGNYKFIDHFIESESLFRGIAAKSTSTNYAGNHEQNGRTSFLGGRIQNVISEIFLKKHEYDKNGDFNAKRIASGNLLFSRNLGNNLFIKGFTMSSDIQSYDGTVVKPIKKLNQLELLFYHIFYNFYGCLASSDDTVGKSMLILPTTYSDKSSIITYVIDGERQIKLGDKSYNLSNLSDELASKILYETIGKFYQDIAFNIVLDFIKIFPEKEFKGADNLILNGEINIDALKLAFSDINNYLRSVYSKNDQQKLMDLAQQHKVELLEDEHISIYNGRIGLNPLLYNYISEKFTEEGFAKLVKSELRNFINSILSSNLYIAVDDPAVLKALDTLGTTADKDYWTNNGMLVLAKRKLSTGVYEDIVQGSNLSLEDDIIINPLLVRYFNSSTVLSSNLRNTLTGTEIIHPLGKSDAYRKLTLNKKLNGKLNIHPNADIILIQNILSSFKNNPNLTQEEKNQIEEFDKIFNDTITELEGIAGAEGALLKRNVIIPATGQYVLQNCINGVPVKVKGAVMEDYQAFVNQFDGYKDNEDSQDGSAINCPFFVKLINNSLQALSVGIDMKPIWHDYSSEYGCADLIKYAAFGMTNLRMRLSLSRDNCDISLFDLFKLMTNIQWSENGIWTNSRGVAIDLVNGKRYGKKIDVETLRITKLTKVNFQNDILLYERLIYKFGNNIREIVNLGKTKFEGISTEIYYTTERNLTLDGKAQSEDYNVYHLYDKDGNEYKWTEELVIEHARDISFGKYHTINSLFELHSALGGIMNVEYNKDSNSYISSEKNIECVVNYMNIISGLSVQLTDSGAADSDLAFKNDFIADLESYYQPLKEMMIAFVTNGSGMKNGRKNTNSAERWINNEKLNTFEINTKGFSIQQDSDHEADEAEMTEPTLVMTALSQGGFLHKYANQIYNAIGKLSLLSANVEISTIKEFLKKFSKASNDKSRLDAVNQLYDIVGRIILNNLSSNNEDKDLSSEICEAIKHRFGINSDDHFIDDMLIPFSDPSIYGHFFPTIISVINKKGIRRKNPGSGMVMAPSYGMFQVFDINGETKTLSDILKESETLIGRQLNSENLTANKLKELVNQTLQQYQQKEQKYNYNPFDIGDRINIYATEKVDYENLVEKHDVYKIPQKDEDGNETDKTNDGVEFKLKTDDSGRRFLLKFDKDENTGELNGQYSIHFLTLKNEKGKDIKWEDDVNHFNDYEKDLLFRAVYNYLSKQQNFSGLSTWGTVSHGGFAGLNRFNKYFGMIPNFSPDMVRHVGLKRDFLKQNRNEDIEFLNNNGMLYDFEKEEAIIPIYQFGPRTSIYINSVDTYYAILQKHWYKLTNNESLKNIENKIPNAIEEIETKGLYLFCSEHRQDAGIQLDLLNIMMDPILRLYDCEETSFEFQRNIIKGRDLAPTKIQFDETNEIGNTYHKSIYQIPIIEYAFTREKDSDDPNLLSNGKIKKPIMDELMNDLKHGVYYDNYVLPEGEIEVRKIGNEHKIFNLQYFAPEAIISNMVANKFGVHYSDSLLDAYEKINFDVDSYVNSLSTYSQQADVRFLTKLNDHVYITFSGLKFNKNSIFHEVEHKNIPRRIFVNAKNDEPSYYQEFLVNDDNEDLYETSRLICVNDYYTADKHGIYDKNGKSINNPNLIKIKIKDTDSYNVYQRFKFLKEYNYIRNNSSHKLYYINEKLIESMAELKYSKIEDDKKRKEKISEFKRKFISDLINKLYSLDLYIAFDYNSDRVDTSLLKNKEGILSKLSSNHNLSKYCLLLSELNKLNEKIININNDIKNSNDEDKIKTLTKNLDDNKELLKNIKKDIKEELTNIIKLYKTELLTSFEISKTIISSRIPAQTLLSFMPMKVVGFTQMPTNVAYVSAILTFLQGSDYDIDKAYMLTHFFDKNGKYGVWSSLFDLSSMRLYEASAKLPIPQKVQLFSKENTPNFTTKYFSKADAIDDDESEKQQNIRNRTIDITNYLININDVRNSTLNDESKKIYELEFLSDLIDDVDNNQYNVYIDRLKKSTPICIYTYNKELLQSKNISEEFINDIIQKIQEHENYELPESMKLDIILNANTSKMAIIIKDLANVNSAHLHIEMGYARKAASKKEGTSKSMTLWNVANIFLMLYENQVGRGVIGIAANGEKGYFTLYYYFTECLKRIKNGDIDSEELKLMTRFNKQFKNLNGGNVISHIANLNKNYLENPEVFKFEVDLMISQLLSAATDNAKELILAKINAGTDLAKIYFYGLILGIDLLDLAKFMTNDVVDLIATLALTNMFDLDRKHVSLTQIINLITDGNYMFYEYMDQNISNFFNLNLSQRPVNVKDINGNNIKIKSLNEFCKLKNSGLINETFYDFIRRLQSTLIDEFTDLPVYISDKNFKSIKRLSAYIEGTSKKIQKIKSKYSEEDFNSIIDDFKKLLEGADELTLLTNHYLSSNQGIPTTADKYQLRLDGIENTVKSREKTLGISKLKGDDLKNQLINIVKLNNPIIDDDSYIENVIDEVIHAGIINNFKYEKWLRDPKYREITKKYYNCIKATFNIFHFLEIHPQFNSNFLLLETSYEMINNLCFKSHYKEYIHREIKKENKYWDSRKDKYIDLELSKYMIKKFLQDPENKISIKLNNFSGELLEDNWELSKNTGKNLLILDNVIDFSNFKLVFETYVIPKLQNGELLVIDSNNHNLSLTENEFIKGLKLKTNFKRPFYALDVDSSTIDSSSSSAIKLVYDKEAFKELRNYRIPGCTFNNKDLSLQDLFVLYNLIVNMNRYGSNTLTDMLKSTITRYNKDSLLVKYIKYIGELDIKSILNKDEIDIKDLVEDVLIDSSPNVSKWRELFHKDKYIKEIEEGVSIIKQKINGNYVKVPFYRNEYGEEEYNPTSTAEVNRLKYGCLESLSDINKIIGNRLLSNNYDIILDTLRGMYNTLNLLIKRNC